MEKKILYFAYGSNMKTDRLLSRVTSAEPVGIGRILNKKLICNKKSKDGSGKANLMDSPEDVVWGVLYQIDSSELDKLDAVEKGYQRTTTHVKTIDNKSVKAEVYISTKLTIDSIPFEWYKKLMICGAQEYRLPEEYINFLKALPSKKKTEE